MPFPNRAGPGVNMLSSLSRKPILSLAALALIVAACGEPSVNPPPTAPGAPNGPNFFATDPFNSEGRCLAADAHWSGQQVDERAGTPGVNHSLDLADPNQNWPANDGHI